MIKINNYDSISYRDAHEILSDRLNEVLYGLGTTVLPKLTLTTKTIDGITYYRWKLDFTDADKRFGKCEYPIELLIHVLAYELTTHTGEVFVLSNIYWDYDTVNHFVKSISFVLLNPDVDTDDTYIDFSGFVDVPLYTTR